MKLIKIIARSFVACSSLTKMTLQPPKVVKTDNFSRDDFRKIISVPIIELKSEKSSISNIIKLVKPFMLKLQKFHPVEGDKIYLNPEKIENWSQLPTEQLEKEGINSSSFTHASVTLNYDNWKADELVKAVIPDGLEPVTSFSKIGHIIHINLKDELLPYKSAISQILKDKTPGCRTIVNKAQSIDNTFRNFQIDLLQGDADYEVEVKENGVTFQFDFASVYWNPRLSTEHERLVKLLNPQDVLYDVFAGVGPFAVPAGKKRVNVLANDLNPHSFKWLEHNVKRNKVSNYVKTFNKDGREFILSDIKAHLLERIEKRDSEMVEYSIHIAMNLPALSVTFLDAFVGLLKDNSKGFADSKSLPVPICHCYCFVKGIDDPKIMAQKLVEEHIGFKLVPGESLQNIHFVRNVAPNKDMMRVDLLLTSDILFNSISHKRSNESCDEAVPCKKSCNDISGHNVVF